MSTSQNTVTNYVPTVTTTVRPVRAPSKGPGYIYNPGMDFHGMEAMTRGQIKTILGGKITKIGNHEVWSRPEHLPSEDIAENEYIVRPVGGGPILDRSLSHI